MKILITGANGLIGTNLIRSLKDSGHEIVATCRDGLLKSDAGFQGSVIPLDFSHALTVNDWKDHLNQVDVVINTVGIMASFDQDKVLNSYIKSTCSLFKACEESNVKRVIHFSALGVSKQAETSYYRMRQKIDQFLKSSCLDYVILKPSLIYGQGGKSAEFFQALATVPLLVLPEKGEQLVQPVCVEDVVEVVTALLSSKEIAREEIEVLGPIEISFKEMLGFYRSWLGLPKAIIFKMPTWVLGVMVRVGDFFKLDWINSDNFTMLAAGNTGNPEKIRNLLQRAPLSMSQALARTPAHKADKIRAKTYFLRPFLRISLGFLWIYTALVSFVLYPAELSYQLLANVGITGALAPFFLYGAAAVDAAIGVLLLCKYKVSLLCSLQVAMIVAYTVIISFFLPEYWLHPFGPVSKNIPLLAAIMILQAMED